MSASLEGDEAELQALILKLEQKYEGDNPQFRKDLNQYGLGFLPFSAQTKKMLLKKLAQKQLPKREPPKMEPPETKPPNLSVSSSCLLSDKENVSTSDDSLSQTSYSSCPEDPNKTFYALCIPGQDKILIESDFLDVLKKMKEHTKQKPRMLSFSNYSDAMAFANKTSADEVCLGSLIKPSYPQEKAELDSSEAVSFPSVSVPQLNALRLHLERGNTGVASELIASNPRYLIGTGDIPTILKAGPRYNALHASIFAGQLASCQIIMKFLFDLDFLKRMYESKERAEKYSIRLVDLYLNTPEKMMNKTPLHFASEKGLADIVAFLVSFKACDRQMDPVTDCGADNPESVKKRTAPPIEIACDKYYNSDRELVRQRIVHLITDTTCFVPLVRSDTTGPYAKVVEPYSPSSHHRLVQEVEEGFKAGSGTTENLKDFSNLKVWAYAGPMSPLEAHKFKREWWSPRVKKELVEKSSLLNVTDGERGFEHFGRELARSYKVAWQEYWPFLDAFADFRTSDGLDKLQRFLLRQTVLLQCHQLLKQNTFLTSPPLYVADAFVTEIKEDDESFVSADSISLASSVGDGEDTEGRLSLDGDNKDASVIRGKEHFYECKEEAWSEDGDGTKKQETYTSPFGRLWNGLVHLSNYLSPKKKEAEESDQDTSPSLKGCDTNSNTWSGHAKERLTTSADRKPCVVEQLDFSHSGEDSPPGEENEIFGDKESPESKVEPEINSKGGKNITTGALDANFGVECSTSQTENAYNGSSWENNTFSTPVSWSYRNSSATDIISPEQTEISSEERARLLLMESPDRQSAESPSLDSKPPSTPPNRNLPPMQDHSFDRKMDSFCRSLQTFSIQSPLASQEDSGHDDTRESEIEIPRLEMFTNQDISDLEKSYTSCVKHGQFPVLLLKQGGRDGCVLADIYFPTVNVEFVTVLEESVQKSALNNVWMNFLVTFANWKDASRVAAMDHPTRLAVTICHIPIGIESSTLNGEVALSKLAEEYVANKRTGCPEADSSYPEAASGHLVMEATAVRDSSLIHVDRFICGSVATKTDGDVFKALNDEAIGLIQREGGALSAVSQWLDRMALSSQESIESLPSPSRVLRLSRHALTPLPVSPLVKNFGSTPSTKLVAVASPLSSKNRSDPVVRNIAKTFHWTDDSDSNEEEARRRSSSSSRDGQKEAGLPG